MYLCLQVVHEDMELVKPELIRAAAAEEVDQQSGVNLHMTWFIQLCTSILPDTSDHETIQNCQRTIF